MTDLIRTVLWADHVFSLVLTLCCVGADVGYTSSGHSLSLPLALPGIST